MKLEVKEEVRIPAELRQSIIVQGKDKNHASDPFWAARRLTHIRNGVVSTAHALEK